MLRADYILFKQLKTTLKEVRSGRATLEINMSDATRTNLLISKIKEHKKAYNDLIERMKNTQEQYQQLKKDT